jgi:hypothetical protein
MAVPEFLSDQQTAITYTWDGAQETGAWPLFQWLDRSLSRKGIVSPAECIETIRPELMSFRRPLTPDTEIRLTALGVSAIDSHSPILHGFTGMLRGCFDLYDQQELGSPAEAHPVIARADDRRFPELRSPDALMLVGRLLEIEEIGAVTFTDDPAMPWTIELSFSIRRFGGVAVFADYVRICYSSFAPPSS